MRTTFVGLLILFFIQKTFGQSITYFKDIEPLISHNCSGCHRPGGIGPFSLQSYDDVSKKGKFVAHVTKTKYMPPWKADATFQAFRNERTLKAEEIELIDKWVSLGMPKGKKVKSRASNVPVEGFVKPDLSIAMSTNYAISDKGVEDFRFFVMPTHLTNDVNIAAIEFIPGNRKQVHHSRIMADTTRKIRGIDGMSEMDPAVKTFQTIPLVDEFLYGWVPGNGKIFFPPGTAKHVYNGTDLVLNIHYSPSSKPQQDQSIINLYYAKGPVEREVHTLTLRENDILNQPFEIPAETLPTFYIRYKVRRDISLISVMPHMHFIGKKFKAEAITPDGEKIPLIRINDWDFNWQSTYQFKKMLKIPAGSVITVEASYDNSSENPANPHHPAKDMKYGWNSTDEMCNLVIYYLDYYDGDESMEY